MEYSEGVFGVLIEPWTSILMMQGMRAKGCAYTVVSGVCQLYPLMMKC